MKRSALCGAVLLLLVPEALAHSPLPGVEGLYLGFFHTATTPQYLICTVALGVLLGFSGADVARGAWAGFAVTLGAGLVLSFLNLERVDPGMFSLLVTLAIAIACLIATTPWLTRVLAVLAGGVIGMGSAPDPGPATAIAATITGTFLGTNFMLVVLFAVTDRVRERLPAAWMALGVRVLGAWAAAMSVLMLAFVFTGG